MNYQAVLTYMADACHGQVLPGLDRMICMTELLHNPQDQLTFIHIAGTNGKGSTTVMVAEILASAGYAVGRFTSPHLVDYTERIHLGGSNKPGHDISQAHFAQIMSNIIENIIPVVLEKGLGHPTEFELLTVLALVYYTQMKVEVAVMEVGLGGRLDPTNIILPVLTLITPVSLDHCQILGHTIAAIAQEKAGIIKPNCPVIVAVQSDEAIEVIQGQAKVHNSPMFIARPVWWSLVAVKQDQQIFNLQTNEHHYEHLCLGLQGEHQIMNAVTAVYAMAQLAKLGWSKVDEAAIASGLANVVWPGRMEYMPLDDRRGVLFDGAHNQAGIQALAKALGAIYGQRPITFIIGILDDKEQQSMLETLVPLASKVYITKPAEKRSLQWAHLAELVHGIKDDIDVTVVDHCQLAMDQALASLDDQGLLCVTGSLYLLGTCRQYFLESQKGQTS